MEMGLEGAVAVGRVAVDADVDADVVAADGQS